MYEISFFTVEIIFVLICAVARVVCWLRNGMIAWKREAILFLMYINFAVIIRFTFFPMAKVNGNVQPLLFDSATVFPFRVNLIPFVNLFDYDDKRDLFLNIIGNAAMFIPSGIVLPIIYKRLDSFWKVVVTVSYNFF